MGSIHYLILLVTRINIDRKTAIDIYQCTGSVLDKEEIPKNSIRTGCSGVFKVTPHLAKMGHGQYPVSDLASDNN